MKRPHNMMMRELIALPVLETVDSLMASLDPVAGAPVHGGAFTDNDGHFWCTVRTRDGWARYPAYLMILAEARRPGREAAMSGASSNWSKASRPQIDVVGSIFRRFGWAGRPVPAAVTGRRDGRSAPG